MRDDSIKKIMVCITALAFICAAFIPTVHSQLGKGFSNQSQQATTTENTIQEKVNIFLKKYTETNSKTIKPNNPFPLDNNPPNIHLPTSQVTMKVFTTTTSYFRTLLSNVPAGYEVSNGNYTGWCSDSAHTINLNTPYQVTLYSSYNTSLPTHLYHQNWSKVNYILNHKIGSDWHQVQYAILYILNFGNQGLNTDGWAMVNDAITYGGSYVPGGGDIIAIIADAGVTVQRTIFELTVPTYSLSISINGNGTVIKNPDQATYTYSQVVQLTANPSIGWTFSHWSGDASGPSSSTSVNMTGNKAVTATFTQCQYTLTITKNGTGFGNVDAKPVGPYYYGAVVTLWANASVNSTFTVWSGALGGTTTPQTLVMDGDKAVNAQFTLKGPYTLTLTMSGTGSGTIQASPSGPYYYGASVTIWANASTGSTFAGFTGALTGTVTPQVLVMNGHKSVDAAFTLNGPYTLTLTMSGTGSGTIQASPSGPYYYGAVVTIWANASVGSTFTGFSGGLSGTSTPQTLTMTSNKNVNAAFTLNGPYTLTLTTSGTGSGTIQASPSGPYYYGAVVTIWANASVGSTFTGFSGGLSGTTTPQTLVMNANKAVNAQFTLQGGYTLTITIQGSGTVTKVPDQTTYTYGQVVNLTANPSTGWVFNHWDGDLTGNTNPTTITMTGNRSVIANFTVTSGYTLTVTIQGSGTVVKVPDQPSYTYSQVVQLTANPATGWVFNHWDGDLTGNANPTTITMTGNKAVTANFTQVGGDITPPLVKIIKPINAMYIFNKPILPFRMPVVVQLITIEVNASDNQSGIDRVEFYIDGVLKGNDSSAPYSYDWQEIRSGKRTIKVTAYDTAGNSASAEILVFKWRFHPILLVPILLLGMLWARYGKDPGWTAK